jgi:hypothetical protein
MSREEGKRIFYVNSDLIRQEKPLNGHPDFHVAGMLGCHADGHLIAGFLQ